MIKFKSRPQCINDFGEKYTESKLRGREAGRQVDLCMKIKLLLFIIQ